jgi:hypothetical protein
MNTDEQMSLILTRHATWSLITRRYKQIQVNTPSLPAPLTDDFSWNKQAFILPGKYKKIVTSFSILFVEFANYINVKYMLVIYPNVTIYIFVMIWQFVGLNVYILHNF